MNEPQMRPTRVLPTEAEVADALHADACPEDPDDGECCTCADYLREARIVLALFGQQRCAPSEAEVADVLRDILVRVFEQDKDIVAQDAARIVLDLFASQPTVAQVKAEAVAAVLKPLRGLHFAKAYTCIHLPPAGELGPCCRHEICAACNQMHPCSTVRLLDLIEADAKGDER